MNEGRERLNYRVLEWVYWRTGEDCAVVVEASQAARELGLSPEAAYRAIEQLTHVGYLTYKGAGPRVCITERGIGYLQRSAWRRRSIRIR